jgi:integrase
MLTPDEVKALTPPATGSKITYDGPGGVPGFGVRVTAAGAKAYILNYRVKGQERRYTLGACENRSLAAARKEANKLRSRIEDGYDPVGDRVAKRDAETVKELTERYLEEHASKKRDRGKAEDESLIKQWIVPELGSLKVGDVEFSHIDRLHRKITKGGKGRKGTPVRANRCLTLLSKMFNLAIRWKMCDANPVKGVDRNHEDPRERYLEDEEIERLTAVLDTHPNQQAANVIRLLLYTGCRRGSAPKALVPRRPPCAASRRAG